MFMAADFYLYQRRFNVIAAKKARAIQESVKLDKLRVL